MATERVELRLDTELLDRVDAWRSKEDDSPSRTEAFRRLIDDGLNKHGHHNARLSDGEKLSLMMMCELYEELGVKGEIDPKFVQETIYGGHYWGLRWQYNGLFHDHGDDPQSVTDVVNILDMWRFIEEGYGRLSDADRFRVDNEVGHGDLKFFGFDHNNESEYASIAKYLVEQLDRFTDLGGRAGLNSHMPTLDRYHAMLGAFEPLRKKLVGKSLNADQLILIVNAGQLGRRS